MVAENEHLPPTVQIDLCRLLVENGYDVNEANRLDHTPLYFAVKSRRHELIKAARHAIPPTPPLALCLVSFVSFVSRYRKLPPQALVQLGADLNRNYEKGSSLLHLTLNESFNEGKPSLDRYADSRLLLALGISCNVTPTPPHCNAHC